MFAFLAISIFGIVFRIAIGVLSIVHFAQKYEYDEINMFPMKSLLQQPIVYFKVDNGSNPIENNHNFFHWEGMYTVENPQCREYDGKY